MYEVLSWLVYVAAGVVMLAAIVFAVLAGLALRFVAESARELVDGPEEDARHTGEPPELRDRGRR